MSTEIDEILAELKRIRKELDELKSFDVPRPSGDFVRIAGDTMTGALGIRYTPTSFLLEQLADGAVADLAGFCGRRTDSAAGASGLFTVKARGTVGAETPPLLNDNLMSLSAGGYSNGAFNFSLALLQMRAAENWSNTARGSLMSFGVTPNGSTTRVERLRLENDGIFSSSSKCAMSPDGGFMVKLTNKTGGASVKGEVVMPYDTSNFAVAKIVQNEPDPIGVFYESGVADGAEAWIVVAGLADVYFVGNTTRGHIARGFVTADAGYVTGQAMSEAVPSSPFATDKHFFELAHVLESRVGAGLARCVLHFN